ncbi:MAG: ATP-binding protein [Symploca sp. SIO3C6]|uniref:ATP-binding protein n=1 Tax=Symploca sp. SIO1C4 TaxID=2607765 RepID=A0A6B3NM33_9CYAN|nr:ATP-binding protein [Symploca sp. SIO3C6]NER30621.1 ATP-binding protein [Symploca sp. SIO1C4]
MKVNLKRFFQACNPAKTLMVGNIEDQKYYIDFSAVRGGEIIQEMAQTISLLSPEPTCQLFTGHLGCGKSTELLRLQVELQQQGFHVVYFESSQDLDMGDVDISDILLAITRQVSASLEAAEIRIKPGYFNKLLTESIDFLKTPIELGAEAELSFGIGKLTAKTKESPQLRSQLRQYLEPRTENLLEVINKDILGLATKELQRRGKEGLVVIIDNLDRVDDRRKESGRTQAEYLFVDRGEQLSKLNCHVVYTLPLVLMFSNDYLCVKNRLGGGKSPKVLPMVPVKFRNGNDSTEGMVLLRQMILARAFPNLAIEQRLELITAIFDTPETLDRLCRISGGHVRNLLGLMFSCIQKSMKLPITQECVESVIREERSELIRAINEQEWQLLRQVAHSKKVNSEQGYQALLRSLFVFEYRDSKDGVWFDVNPMLVEAAEI